MWPADAGSTTGSLTYQARLMDARGDALIATDLGSRVERAQKARRVRDVRESERRRIARALHDETLQELAVALARAAKPSHTEGTTDKRLVTTLQRIGEQVRSAIHDLRPPCAGCELVRR